MFPKLVSVLPKLKPYLGAVLSSLLWIPTLPSAGSYFFFSWLAWVPWLYSIRKLENNKNTCLKKSVCFAALFNCVLYTWLPSTLVSYFGWSEVKSYLLLGFLGWLMQLQIIFFGLLYSQVSNGIEKFEPTPIQRTVYCLLFALIYSGLDWYFPKIFRDTLGLALVYSPTFSQVVDLGGIPLLTFLILFVNLALTETIILVKKSTDQVNRQMLLSSSFYPLLLAIGFMSTAYVYGKARYQQIRLLESQAEAAGEAHGDEQNSKTIQVALVQGNITHFPLLVTQIGSYEAVQKVLGTYIHLSEKVLSTVPRPQLLIWPETVYPTTFGTPKTPEAKEFDQKIVSFVEQAKVPLIFGALDQDDNTEQNSAFLIHPKSLKNYPTQTLVYHKRLRLPFAEYTPGLPASSPEKSSELTVFRVQDQSQKTLTTLAPIICYDTLFPEIVRNAVVLGGQILVNLTNDSWFDAGSAPSYHLQFARIRSIETRRPQLRVTTSGISAVILPSGDLAQSLTWNEPGTLSYAVPVLQPIKTLILDRGDWFAPFSLGISIPLLVITLQKLRSLTLPKKN